MAQIPEGGPNFRELTVENEKCTSLTVELYYLVISHPTSPNFFCGIIIVAQIPEGGLNFREFTVENEKCSSLTVVLCYLAISHPTL